MSVEFWGLTVCCAARVPVPGPRLMFVTAVSADRFGFARGFCGCGRVDRTGLRNLSCFICPAVCSSVFLGFSLAFPASQLCSFALLIFVCLSLAFLFSISPFPHCFPLLRFLLSPDLVLGLKGEK